jgi:leucyl-tRNA synthetase
MEQWFFRITSYADALLHDHALIDWPERTKTIQRNWIGRSEGAELLCRIDELDVDVPVFTTRADTVFGATFFVLAPEHPLVDQIAERSPHGDEIREYVKHSAAKRGEERAAAEEKTGVFTGFYAANPATDELIPVWVADYVLMEYGTGAIMGVPAHDERDRAFAERFDLAITQVVDEEVGVLVNSGQFTGMPVEEGLRAIVEWLGERGRGRPAVSFRLRDWGFSRQRYWGCPIPVVYCDSCGIVPVPDDELPVARWLADFWAPVDQYIGGIDHATGHLLYSRFFVKVMNEMEMVGFREPFQRLFHQGWVRQGGTKMSKSRGNVTAPDLLAEMYGADAVRLYILFVGPADQDMDWTEEGIEGVGRFLRRLWRIVHEAGAADAGGGSGDGGPLVRKTHETIAKVSDDIGRRFVFNTPIAAVMELVNELGRDPSAPGARFAAETAVSLIQPYAPHIAEELWESLGHSRLWEQPWPAADEAQLRRETFELVIQVNGRVRDRVQASIEESEDELVARAKASERVQAQLDGKEIRQAIVVPGKLVNLVV